MIDLPGKIVPGRRPAGETALFHVETVRAAGLLPPVDGLEPHKALHEKHQYIGQGDIQVEMAAAVGSNSKRR